MLLGRYLGPPIFLDTPGGLGGGWGGGGDSVPVFAALE